MLNVIAAFVTNSVFLVPLHVSRYRKAHPNSRVLIASATKAIQTVDQDVMRGLPWVLSRRGTLIVTPEELVCGNWVIPVKEVTSARLLAVTGGYVLTVKVNGGPGYQFGLVPNPAIETSLPLAVPVERGTVRLSAFSSVLRITAGAMLLYILWDLLNRK